MFKPFPKQARVLTSIYKKALETILETGDDAARQHSLHVLQCFLSQTILSKPHLNCRLKYFLSERSCHLVNNYIYFSDSLPRRKNFRPPLIEEFTEDN